MSIAHFMTLTKSYVDQYGNPVHYGSFFTNDPRFDAQFTAWADTPQGMDEEFLTAMRAAGTNHPIQDPPGTHSGPGASTPIWGAAANIAAAQDLLSGASFAANQMGEGRGYSETAILTAPVGHGPGAV